MSGSKYISIAGNIGVGKTTFTRILGDRLGWTTYFEPVIDNPYLEDFYGDMKRWSFPLQIYFLSKRFIALKEMIDSDQFSVQDRTIYEDVEIFAKVLHDRESMDHRDYENYRSLFYCMVSYLQKPTLIIYLKASTDTIITRIKSRGRGYEKTIDPEYLHRLNVAYDDWINRAKKEFKLYILETDRLNLEDYEGKVEDILKLIDS